MPDGPSFLTTAIPVDVPIAVAPIMAGTAVPALKSKNSCCTYTSYDTFKNLTFPPFPHVVMLLFIKIKIVNLY